MGEMKTTVNELIEAIKEADDKKTAGYDTTAEVRRITDGIAWVHIPGGVDETPVALTISATVGDIVQIRVSGGSAWITGNKSAPPTDDAVAIRARGVAIAAQNSADEAQETAEAVGEIATDAKGAATEAGSKAEQALNIAEGVDDHFWYDNTGAHVTQVTQEDWNDSQSAGHHSGGNTLITSGGVAIRDGLTELATFGASGAQVGQTGQSKAQITPYAFMAADKEGDAFFVAEDLRNESGGVHSVVDQFISDGITTNINLTYRATNTNYQVTVDGGAPPASMTKTQTQIVFGAVPEAGSVIVANYKTASQYAKAYTLGIRAANSVKGGMSTAEGQDCVASGRYSHAEGHGSQSTGAASHAEGVSSQATGTNSHAEGSNTQATSNGSHAEGLYTEANGYGSHSEGQYCKAILDGDHAEGLDCVASGANSHAEGYGSVASERMAHAQNWSSIANQWGQTALGTYNEADTTPTSPVHPNGYTDFGHYAVIVGNGSSDAARSNALTVDWRGNVKAAGSITVNGHNTAIGYKTGRQTGTYSLASGTTWDTVPSGNLSRITLGAGTWIIQAHAAFESNNTGRRAMRIYSVTGSEGLARSFVNQTATNGANTNMQTMAIVSLDSSTTFTIQLAQNSGSAKSVDLVLEAVRIA